MGDNFEQNNNRIPSTEPSPDEIEAVTESIEPTTIDNVAAESIARINLLLAEIDNVSETENEYWKLVSLKKSIHDALDRITDLSGDDSYEPDISVRESNLRKYENLIRNASEKITQTEITIREELNSYQIPTAEEDSFDDGIPMLTEVVSEEEIHALEQENVEPAAESEAASINLVETTSSNAEDPFDDGIPMLTEVVSEEEIQALEKGDAELLTDSEAVVETIDSTDVGVIDSVEVPVTMEDELSSGKNEAFGTAREEWRKAKGEYQSLKRDYEAALKKSYQDHSKKSLLGRLGANLREKINFRTREEFREKMIFDRKKADFKSARKEYASKLQSILTLRSKTREDLTKLEIDAASTKTAFARKFISRPLAEANEIKKNSIESSETVNKLNRVLAIFKKNKWTMRVGAVTITGVAAGLATGGAGILLAGGAAAGLKALRIAGGVGGGILGAHAGNFAGSGFTGLAERNLGSTVEKNNETFTIENIDSLEQDLEKATSKVEAAKIIKKILTISGAIAGGASAAESIDVDSIDSLSSTLSKFRTPEIPTLDESGFPTDVPVSVQPEVAAVASIQSEAVTVAVEKIIQPHTVESGDTLWEITESAYGDKLKHLNESGRGQVLGEVFKDLRSNTELIKGLGLRSGNIDLIYPDEKINPAALNALIDSKISILDKVTTEQLPTMNNPLVTEPVATAPVFETVDFTPSPEAFTTEIYENPSFMNVSSVAANEINPIPSVNEEVPAVENLQAKETIAATPDYRARTEAQAPAPLFEATVTNADLIRIATKLELPTPLTQEVLDTYGSVETFKAERFTAIEEITGKQPSSWLGREKFEPVFEKIKSIPLGGGELENGVKIPGMDYLKSASVDQKMAYLRKINLDGSQSNLTALNNWVGHYLDMTSPTTRNGFGLPHTPNTTYNEMFTRYILEIKK